MFIHFRYDMNIRCCFTRHNFKINLGSSTIYKWIYIFRKEANLVIEGKFIIRNIYDDAATYNVVGAASKVLG
jgi:hypothetical protein